MGKDSRIKVMLKLILAAEVIFSHFQIIFSNLPFSLTEEADDHIIALAASL